jgi:glycerol kinase
MTRNTGPADLCRAALESVCYQTRDLFGAMTADWAGAGGDTVLRVDGGMTASDWTMQFLADILGAPVDRPKIKETTAIGAAMLAGVGAGVFADLDEAADVWQLERRFEPAMDGSDADRLYAGWQDAVARTLSRG